jgi:hypothetical protein
MRSDEFLPESVYDRIREQVNLETKLDLSFEPTPEIKALCNYIAGLEQRIDRLEIIAENFHAARSK